MAQTMRDPSWEQDVRWHVVRAMTERDRHSLAANLIAWSFCALASLALPDTSAFILPLALQLIALTTGRIASHHLRTRLEKHEPYETALRHVAFSLGFAGACWGLLLWPIMQAPPVQPPAMAIVAVTITVVSLVTTMTGVQPRILFSFLGGFMGMVVLGLYLVPPVASPSAILWTLISLIGIASGTAAYCLGTARGQIALAERLVENRQLSEELANALCHSEFLSQRDPLTGLFNRRVFFEQAGLVVAVPAVPEVLPDQYLLVIDLDHFKQINDHFGHDTGDCVLIAAADAMREIASDLPGGPHCAVRLGGEEFAMILTGLDRLTATAAAEAVRLRISRIALELGMTGLQTSASIGMTACCADEALEAALNRADLAMYRAKENGRNRVIQAAA